nr:MAG TPA: hypothetical protein [Caudoviricetes sp.]
MFSTNIRVACSVLSMRTVSASASAFIDSAFAFLMVARSVLIATRVATKPPPRRTFRTSLIFMPSIFLLLIHAY